MTKPLIERMKNKKAPKVWINEILKLQKTIEDQKETIEEHLCVIDALAIEREEFKARLGIEE